MIYEPTKKNYYRFPSNTSIQNLDSKYYFPDKPHASSEDTRYESKLTHYVPDRVNYYDI